MSDPERNALRTAWQRLAQRYDWQLAQDEAAFLESAATELQSLVSDASLSRRCQIAVWRAYSALLYRGLWHGQERAAQELWLAFARLALGKGVARPNAEELAQETVTRALEKLPVLQQPQSLLSWALTIFRTVRRESQVVAENEIALPHDPDDRVWEIEDPANLAADVEERLVSRELQALLWAKLPNDLERLVLLRIVVLDDKPRDVARDLGLPLHRARIAKHRALARLKEDSEVFEALRDLVGDPRLTPTATEGEGDGPWTEP